MVPKLLIKRPFFINFNVISMQISVTPNNWIKTLEFVDVINQAEHVDVEYIFRFLLHSDAFEFSSVYEIVLDFNLDSNCYLKLIVCPTIGGKCCANFEGIELQDCQVFWCRG